MKTSRVGTYVIHCVANDMRYIGHSDYDIGSRLSVHWTMLRKGMHHNRNLQKLFDVYGKAGFKVTEKLCTNGLIEEARLIRYWNSRGLCLNLHPSAASAEGYKFNEAQRAKSSASAKLRCTEEWKNAVSQRVKEQHKQGRFGRVTWSEETEKLVSKKLSATFKGRPNPRPEGWVCSEESRERYRQAAIKREAARKLQRES